MGIVKSVVGFILATFVLAAIYGSGCEAMDYLNSQKDPVATGRAAAAHVYGLFGVVTEEANRNDGGMQHMPSPGVARKIAAPYAVTADVAALLSGKLANGATSIFRTVDKKVSN